MAFTDPFSTNIGATLGISQSDQGVPALTPNAPSAVKALGNKYTPGVVAGLHQTYGPDLTNSLIQWELQRAQNGTSPVNGATTLRMLQTAQSKVAATPAPEGNPWDIAGNIARDVGSIVTGIPKMPGQIIHDVTHVGEIPGDLAAIGSGDFSKIGQTPLLRMVPGAFTAQNLLTGNLANAAEHPVMTALDVAPYAKGLGVGAAVKGLPVPGTDGLSVGDVIDNTKAALGRTLPGQFLKESFGKDTRALSATMAEQPELLQQRMVGSMRDVYTDGLSQLGQQASAVKAHINEAIPDIARQGEIKAAITNPMSVGATDVQGALDALNATDGERGAVQKYQEISGALAQYGLDSGSLTRRFVMGQDEMFTPQDAAKLDKANVKLARINAISTTRDAILDPATADYDKLTYDVHTALSNPALKASQVRNIAQGYVHALDVAGYDTGDLLSRINSQNRDNMVATITSTDPTQMARVQGDVLARPARGVPALDSRTRWLDSNREFTPKALEKAQNSATGRETNTLPARWQPAFQQFKMDAAKSLVEQRFTPDDPALPTLMDAIHSRIYSDLPKEDLDTINAQALQEVSRLRQAGVDPVFVHSVSPEAARAMASPTVTSIVPSVTQWRSRINDWTPGVDSLGVSVQHQAFELLRQDHAQTALDSIRDQHTVKLGDISEQYRSAAQSIAARSGDTVGHALESLVNKDYRLWSETENGFLAGNAQRFKFSSINADNAADTLLIPKHLANSLEMLASPPTYSRLLDPVTRVFKTAVLPFSVRWYTHHIVGNVIAGLMEDPRFAAQLPDAMNFMRDVADMNKSLAQGRVDYELDPATVDTLNRMPSSMRAQLNSLKYSVEPDQLFKLKAGGKLGELAQAAGENRLIQAGKSVEDWSYNFVNNADTLYRVAGYLSGEKGGLAEGLSAADAGARGMALVNKFMPRWLEMTPMERSVFRVAFPFYGIMSHVFRYAMRYPVDHPWRTAVFANMARAEQQDLGTGLPQALAGTFFLGSPDSSGNVTGVTVPTPFQHLGDELTLAGLLGETNPLFKVALQQVGYDPAAHGANLYPEVTYDPTTGKLVAKPTTTGGLLGQLASAIVPQSNIFQALAGTSGDLRNLISGNPAAANRLLLSSAGVPILWKNYNLNTLAFSGEAARSKQATAVLNAAMKSGDYSEAMNWPSLRPYVAQLQKLSAGGQLASFVKGATAAPPSIAQNNASTVGSQANTQAEVTTG